MADPITVWRDDHVSFARLLDGLGKQVAILQTGKEPRYSLMWEIVYYLRHFPDRFHHPLEEVAFARLVAHDPSLLLVINGLLQEHRVIAEAGEELLKYLSDVPTAPIKMRAKVEAAAATYLVYYRDHLAKEEKVILPRVAQLLTQEDWAEVDAVAAVPARPDPLFGDDFEARYQELLRQIAFEAREP